MAEVNSITNITLKCKINSVRDRLTCTFMLHCKTLDNSCKMLFQMCCNSHLIHNIKTLNSEALILETKRSLELYSDG